MKLTDSNTFVGSYLEEADICQILQVGKCEFQRSDSNCSMVNGYFTRMFFMPFGVVERLLMLCHSKGLPKTRNYGLNPNRERNSAACDFDVSQWDQSFAIVKAAIGSEPILSAMYSKKPRRA